MQKTTNDTSAETMCGVASVLRTSISNSVFLPPNEYAAKLRSHKGKIIALDGIPCAGKTHLGKAIRDLFLENGVPAVFLEEKMNQDHLQAFYSEMERLERMREEESKKPVEQRKEIPPNKYAFSLQLCAMQECIRIYKEAVWYAGRGPGGGMAHVVIIDRPIWGNRVFEQLHVAKKNITAEEHTIYDSYVASHGPYYFDHLVYLYTSPEKAHYRVHHVRKHKAEIGMPLLYLKELEMSYYHHLHKHLEQGDRSLSFVANNDAYCSAEGVIETLGQYKTPPKQTRSAEEILSIPGEVEKVLTNLCEYYN